MRGFSLCALSAFALAAQAQDWEVGARYWFSKSSTTRSHNAQGLAPTLGNPTSVLTYDNLSTPWLHRAGLVRRRGLPRRSVQVFRLNVQRARQPHRLRRPRCRAQSVAHPHGRRRLFVGYHHWSERLDAYGATFTLGGGAPIASTQPVISNEVTWRSLRVGIVSTAELGPRSRLSLDAAWVPYAKVRDEDSHWLRQDPGDLGPAPNIFIEGRGGGLQLDLEWRQALAGAWEMGAGLRHWWLRARSGRREAAGTSVPLSELESQRSGVTLGVGRRW